jgi:uncharacterized protein
MTTLLIGLAFCFGFFMESIIGFGGTLVAFSILGFFIDIKELVLIGIYIATCASIFVISSDYKSFNVKIFFQSFPLSLLGTILGVTFFVKTSSNILLTMFAIFLIILSIKVTFFDNIVMHGYISKLIIVVGGFSQGVFGIGGPFFAIALKNKFQNKSELRATLGGFFIIFNMVRVIQLLLQNHFSVRFFADYWWVPLPLCLAIYLGHKVHRIISEKGFKNVFSGMSFFAGIEFFFK